MGVNLAQLPPLQSGTRDVIRITAVGRCVEKKGHEFTLRALHALRVRRPDLPLRLDLIGEGPLLDDLQTLATALGLEDLVRFMGPLSHPEVLQALSATDIVSLPSVTAADGDKEGIPVVLMEAMAMRIPVVSTFHSGIPELVSHETSGLLSLERDVGTLARNIERLADDPAFRAILGEAARARIEAEFETAALGRSLRRHYAALLS
jgi:colanic acid/amylovoran biosynthesis glycosyltransferase